MYGMTDSDWQAMDADDAEAMAAGLYAGDRDAKVATMKPAAGGFDIASREDVLIGKERRAEAAYNACLYAGKAGTPEAAERHAFWMQARTERATFDAERKAEQLAATAPIATHAESIFRYAPTLAQFDIDNGWEL